MRLTFLGTGASGGTPGPGRSQRRESSLLVECGASVMIDVTRDFATQVAGVENIDAVLLTHAHRDAAGGLPALRRWWEERDLPPLPLLASPQAVAVICERHRRLDHVRPLALEPGERVAFEPAVKPVEALAVEPGESPPVGGVAVTPVEVPHAREARFRTYAWRLEAGGAAVVYASDVGRLEPALRRLARDAGLLVIDGAMWKRSLFAHLTADRALPELCGWPVRRILLTQIGRTAPRHEELERAVAALCPRAAPAWDGLVATIP